MEHEIVVLGAGYTGMMAAIGAARRTRRHGGRVTLVNPSSRFTERLRMHQIATGQELADLRIPALLAGTGITFVEGWAEAVDTERQEVRVGERVLHYDTLVYAIGSRADTGTVPGAGEFAYTLDSPAAATELAGVLRGTVVVGGGGLTGIEAAAEIAESHPDVHVVLLSRDVPGSMMSDKARGYLTKALHRLGVEVRAGVEITKVLPNGVELAGGEHVHADAVLWTTGFAASPLAAEAGLDVDERGRIVVDSALRSTSHPTVYAVGDAAAVRQPWGTIHGTCQSGIPTGARAAENIARQLRGKQVKPFRFGYIHQPVSLGRNDAVIQFTRGDDSPRRWFITGRLAVFYKETVTSSPAPTYRLAKRIPIPAAVLSSGGGKLTRSSGSR